MRLLLAHGANPNLRDKKGHSALYLAATEKVVNGRRRFHTADFARDELRFEDFERATEWERANIAALLCI